MEGVVEEDPSTEIKKGKQVTNRWWLAPAPTTRHTSSTVKPRVPLVWTWMGSWMTAPVRPEIELSLGWAWGRVWVRPRLDPVTHPLVSIGEVSVVVMVVSDVQITEISM
jgi:hypothetical protein